MSNLISKNKCVKYISAIVISILFVLMFVPIVSIIFEIIFNAGTLLGSFIRSYGAC